MAGKTARVAKKDKSATRKEKVGDGKKLTDRMSFWVLLLVPAFLTLNYGLATSEWLFTGFGLVVTVLAWSQIMKITTKSTTEKKEKQLAKEAARGMDQGEFLMPRRK